MSRGTRVLLSLICGLLATGAAAQTDPRTDSPRDSKSPDSTRASAPDSVPAPPHARGVRDTVTVLRGVTIEGARAPHADHATQTSTRLDRGALVRFLPSTPTDAMVTAPGVDLVKTGPWASRVSFRGFQGERVLVTVDGVRLNTGRGHGSNTSLVSVDRLDQVELAAGSGGAEYGSDALGGVINLVTHRPLFADQPSLTLTLNARGATPGGEFAQGERLRFMTRRLGAEVSAGTGSLRELVTPVEHVENSGSRDDDYGARVAVRLGEGTVDVEHTRHAAHDVGLPAINGRFPIISRDATRAEWESPFMAAPFGWALPLHARLLASDQRYVTETNETNADTVVSRLTRQPIATNTSFDRDHTTTRSTGLAPQVAFGEAGRVRFGGEYRHEKTRGPKWTTVTTRTMSGDVTNVDERTSDNVPDAARDVLAGSVSARHDWGRVRIENGIRLDWLRSRADSTASSWSPALDVTDRRVSLDGGLAVRAGSIEPYGRVASGFRAPNLEERYFNGPVHGGLLLFGDPALRPERNVTYEAGVRADADGWGSARVSAYRVYAEDFIGLEYRGLVRGQNRFQYHNLDRVQIDGLEGTGRLRWHGAGLTLSATLPRGRDLATGKPLNDVGVSRFSADVTAPVGPWMRTGMVAVRARWSNRVKGNSVDRAEALAVARPAFWTVNTEFATTVFGTRATVAVRNVFDHHYREAMSFIDEPGRTLALALKRDFQVPLRTRGGGQ